MNMKTKNLTNCNFILIVIGQIISLFGNNILRFSLPLYILQQTGSSAIFGIVSAISFLPLIFVMPIGGILADRLNKKNIMVILDFVTGILMTIFLFSLNKADTVILLIFTMMILYAISGIYQPAVQASMPILLDKSILVKGNSVISSVSALSNLLSPIISGFLFAVYGIIPIISVSIICFFISALFEIFIKIPHSKYPNKQSVFCILKDDITISIKYIFKEKIILAKIILIACILNAFVGSLITISLPILVTERLSLSSNFYGIASGVLAFGGLCGGLLTATIKPQSKKIHKYFFILVFTLIPLAVAPLLKSIKSLSFALILTSAFLVMCISTTVSILLMTYIQNNIPENIVGKVTALLLTLSVCSQPIGQAFYGLAFEYAKGYESTVIIISVFISLIVGFYTKLCFTESDI